MKKILLAVTLAVTCSEALALKEYYTLSRSVRALGMGNAFYAVSDDEYALFFNPAGLSATSRTGGLGLLNIQAQLSPSVIEAVKAATEGGTSAASIADKLQKFQGKPMYAGVGLFPFFRMKNFAFGILVGDTKMHLGVLGRDLDTTLDLTIISDSGVLLGYSREWMEGLHIGATLKGIVRGGGKKIYTTADISKKQAFSTDFRKLGGVGGGVDFDLGAIYELPIKVPYLRSNRAALSLNNLLASRMTISRQGEGTIPGLTRTFSLGWHTVTYGVGPIDNVHLMFDLAEFQIGGESDPDYGARTGSLWKHVNFGVEVPFFSNLIDFRAGMHQGYPAAGLGLNLRVVRLELATYTEEAALLPGRLPSRRYALQLTIGAQGGRKPLDETYRAKEVPPTEEVPVPEKPKEKAEPEGLELEPKTKEKKEGGAVAPEGKPGGAAPTELAPGVIENRAPKGETAPAGEITPSGEAAPQGEPAPADAFAPGSGDSSSVKAQPKKKTKAGKGKSKKTSRAGVKARARVAE